MSFANKIILSVLLLFTFSSGRSQVEISFVQPPVIDIIECPLFAEVQFTSLQQQRIGMIAPDMEMKFYDNNYFILDNKFTQCVYRYNENGELINTICEQDSLKQVKNKLVLRNPTKFNINPFLKQVELYSFEESTIKRFTYEGKKIDQISFPIIPADFTRTKEGNYLIYTGWNNKESQYRLLFTDKSGRITDKKMRLVSKCTHFEGYSFYTTDNGIFMCELLGNSTYMIDNKNVEEKYFFNFGIKNLLPNFHILEAYDSYQLINHAGYYTIKKYLENKNYAYFFLNFTSSDQKDMYHVIYDKNNKIIYSYIENAGIGAFDKAQALTDNDELVFLVAPRKFRQLFSSDVENISPIFNDFREVVNSEKNTIVLKIKLQSL